MSGKPAMKKSCYQALRREGAGPDRLAKSTCCRRRGDRMLGRRAFISLLGGAATWPLAARAQPGERMRRIGVLLPAAADNREFQVWVGAFLQGPAQSGWILVATCRSTGAGPGQMPPTSGRVMHAGKWRALITLLRARRRRGRERHGAGGSHPADPNLPGRFPQMETTP
jgi:hypothetical protein